MKIKTWVLYLLTGFVFSISSCRTDKCKNSKCSFINKIDPEFARYWEFKEGSYWIYQLISDTSVLDTVTVELFRNGDNDACSPYEDIGAPPCTEFTNIYLFHSNYSYFQSTGINSPKRFSYYCNGSYKSKLRMPSSTNTYYGTSVLQFIRDNSSFSEMSLKDSNAIWINKINYKNTAHLTTNMDTVIHKKIYLDQWWVKDVGMVKFVLSGDLVWELKKYNIKK